MSDLIFYSAFLGTFLSVTFLTSLAWKEHDPNQPRSLSQLSAQNKRLVNRFRVASVVCATLFAVTMYFFIIPEVKYQLVLFAIWSIAYFTELLVAIFPERGTIERQLHSLFAYIMGHAMLAIALIFIFELSGRYRIIEIGIFITMGVLGILARLDVKRFIFYEMPFIYLSHISILVAAIALN